MFWWPRRVHIGFKDVIPPLYSTMVRFRQSSVCPTVRPSGAPKCDCFKEIRDVSGLNGQQWVAMIEIWFEAFAVAKYNFVCTLLFTPTPTGQAKWHAVLKCCVVVKWCAVIKWRGVSK